MDPKFIAINSTSRSVAEQVPVYLAPKTTWLSTNIHAGFVTSEDRRNVAVLLAICLSPFIITYSITQLLFWISTIWSKKTNRLPPTIPYAIPLLGNAIELAVAGPLAFVKRSTWALKKPGPFAITLFSSKVYFLQGAQNVVSLWKKSHQMAGMTAQIFCLKYLFGMPEKALCMYLADDSGFHDKSHYDSKVDHADRVDYQTHLSLLKFTNGKGLTGFYSRWKTLWVKRLQTLEIGDEWVDMPDLLAFYEEEFASTVVEATCGPILEQVNPRFTQDLALYERYTSSLSKGLPRWMAPRAYSVRDRLIADIKKWHAVAKDSFDALSIDADGDADPYWGSEFIRSRQEMFKSFRGFDAGAAASSDLGFIWALTFNIVPTSMWVTTELYRDPSLLSQIRCEVGTLGPLQNLDVKKLLALPRLQAVYAETLRLRIHVIIPREPEREELRINEWLCPKGSTVVVASHPAHMDNTVWNTGKDNAHPVDTFWAQRFLSADDDPKSGPCARGSEVAAETSELGDTVAETVRATAVGPRFVLSGTAGHWFPYGGGPRICPGRHFAKRAILTAAAIVTEMFDIEITANPEEMRMDSAGYGLGMQRPVGKVAYRIRRRQPTGFEAV